MFNQLLNIVKDRFNDTPGIATEISAEQQEGVQQEIANTIIDGLKSRLTGGGIGDLAALFGGNASGASRQISSSISGSLLNNLRTRFNLPEEAISVIAGSLLPAVLQKFITQINDPADGSITPESVLNHLSDGKTQGMDVNSALNAIKQGNPSSPEAGELSRKLGF
jgi:hypothetical protein